MKTCIVEGCADYIWSSGYCKYHQYKRNKKGASKKHSKKRKAQVDQYHTLVRDRASTALKTPSMCFFCNKKIVGIISNHHLKGREYDKLIDEEWIVPSHNLCHVHLYHSASVKILLKMDWYQGFLLRLKDKDVYLWKKEIYKQVKANIITNEEYLNIIKL